MSEEIKNESIVETPASISTIETSAHNTSIDLTSNRESVAKTPRRRQSGYVATGTHGGMLVPVGCVEYLAGADIGSIKLEGIMKMQPLKHVSFDKLRVKLFAVHVPNVRVWDDADRFSAQREDVFTTRPLQVPTVSNASACSVRMGGGFQPSLQSTTLYRETAAYHYYGISTFNGGQSRSTDVNVLPIRGYFACFNDIFRDKRSQAEVLEYTGAGTAQEQGDYFSCGNSSLQSSIIVNENFDNSTRPMFLRHVAADKNYWNDWRPYVFSNDDPVDNTSLFSHNVTQRMIDEYRQQTENISKTDAQIIAELRGTKIATDRECTIIGRKSIDIDLSIATQDSETEQLALGADGAISYTFVSADFGSTNGFRHPKDGYIHYFMIVSMPDNSIYSHCQNIEILKNSWNDFYRPGMKEIKDVPLLTREVHNISVETNQNTVMGWRRRFGEYFRHPNFVRGDFLTDGRIFSPVNGGRGNANGFQATTLDGSSTAALPSTADWTSLRTQVEVSSLSNNGIDMTDTNLRRLLLIDGGDISTTLHRRRTNQTFYFVGKVHLDIAQPIDSKIANNFIAYGDE